MLDSDAFHDAPDDVDPVRGASQGRALDDRYALGALLGSGGVAQVYRARDLLLERDVAVKLFGPGIDPHGPERERAEMRTVAGLSHPNLVTVHDAGTDTRQQPPRAYLVMALIDGPSLLERLRAGPMSAEVVRRLASDVASALAYVHSRGVVHRDVKPANILLDQDGQAYLADFGIAQTIGADALTAAGDTLGTAAYLSPEQVRGHDVSTAADVYAFGLVLLEALTGEREYPGTTAETALARLSRPPHVAGRVPDSWRALLSAMTATDPPARPTAREVYSVLTQEISAPGIARQDDRHLTQVLGGGSQSDDQTRLLTSAMRTGSPPEPGPSRDAGSPRVPPRIPRPGGSTPARSRRSDTLSAPAIGIIAAVIAAVLLVLAISSLGSGSSSGTKVPPPPAGQPGPARLGPDLTRLHRLVQP